MLVKKWMTQPVISIDKEDTIGLANQLMRKNNIRVLPVLSKGELVGIVTDRDLKKVSVSENTGLDSPKIAYLNTRVKIKSIMTKNVITTHPDSTVEEVAKILLKKKISGLPVIDSSNNIIGIITLSDIVRLLVNLTGIESEGIQIALEISTRSGSVNEVAAIVRGLGGSIFNLLTSYDRVPDGYRHIYFKTYDIAADKMDELIKQLSDKAKILYIIEHVGEGVPPKIILMNY